MANTRSPGGRRARPAWTVYISPEMPDAMRMSVEVCVRVMGGTVAASVDEAIAAEGSPNGHGATNEGYIVCLSSAYETYVKARESHYIPIVTPIWAFRSVLHNAQVLLPTEKFSANPRKVFSSIVLYTSQVEPEPSKVLRTLIAHSGGQVLSHPSRSATHMLCLRPEGDAFQQALNWDAEGATLQTDTLSDEDVVRAATAFVATNVHGPIPDVVLAYIIGQSHLTKHRIVNYLWIYECIRVNQLLPETLYGFEHNHKPSGARDVRLSDVVMALQCDSQLFPPVSEALPLDIWRDISQNAAKEWADNAFVVASHIATGLRQRMLDAIQGLGAKVLVLRDNDDDDESVMDGATYVVCSHQTGRAFDVALARGKTIVGIQWLAASLALRTLLPANFDEPTVRNVLWYPAKQFGSIPGMEGLIITLSGFTVRSTPSRDDMQAMIRLVGACWLPVLSRSHTSHLICFEASGEKYQRALTWDLPNVVKFEWILACVQQWRYVPEAEFSWEPKPPKMPKFDVRDALQVLEAKQPSRVTPLKPKEPETTFVSTLTTPVLLRNTQPDATDVPSSAPTAPKPDLIVTASAKSSVKSSVKSSAKTSAKTTTKAAATPARKAATTPAPAKKAAAKRASAGSDASVSVLEAIRPATAKKTAKETKRKGKTQSEPEPSDVVVVKQRRTTARSKTPKRMFLLTGTHEELAINESIVQFLGGVVVHSARAFDPACTHVICKELRRTEKIIAACASGKWILTPDYLRDSRAQGLFLSEEGYEWGLDKVSKDHYCDPRIWLPVAKYWRTHLAAGGARAFDKWTFAILGETVPPPSMCTHVIVAAGGVVLDVPTLLKKFGVQEPPMVVLVADAVKKTDKLLKSLLEKKVPLVKPGFLIDYITKDQHARPELQQYYYLP